MIKKILVCILSLMLLLNGGLSSAQEKTADIEAAEKALLLFEDMEISLPLLDLQEDIPRRDFFMLLLALFGVDSAKITEEVALDFAVTRGIIASKESYDPSRSIYFKEAFKACVVAAGYANEAMAFGGYPSGYVTVALRLGLSGKTAYPAAETLTFADALIMMETLGSVEIRVQTGYGLNNEYRVLKDATPFSLYHGIYKVTGIIDKNEYSSLYDGDSKAIKGRIEIDGETYGYDKAANLGERVEAFVKSDDLEQVVFHMRPYKTEKTVIPAEDVENIANGRILYVKNGKEYNAQLKDSYAVIYNGVAFPRYNESELKPKEGELILIDNNKDGLVDLVHVWESRTIFVGKADTYNRIYYDKNGDGTLDLSDPDVKFIIKSGDNILDPEKITKGCVLTVYPSKDGSYAEIELNNEAAISGRVTEISMDTNSIMIDETNYECNAYFVKHYLPEIEVMNEVSVLKDSKGRLAAMDEKVSTLLYGLLTGTMKENGLDGRMQMRIFTEDDELKIFNLVENVKINGTVYDDQQIIAEFARYTPGNEKLIRYKLNSQGEIENIVTAGIEYDEGGPYPSNPYASDEQIENGLVRHYFENYETTTVVYRTTGRFGNRFFIENATAAFFYIINDDTLSLEDRYSTQNTINSGSKYSLSNFKVYNVSEKKQANAIVYISQATGSLDAEATSGVVESVKRAVVSSDEVGVKVTVCEKGYFKELFIADENAWKHIEKASPTDEFPIMPGDYIRYSANHKGYITRIEKDFEFKTKTLKYTGSLDSGRYYFVGKAVDITPGRCLIIAASTDGSEPDMGDINKRDFVIPGSTFMLFDTQTKLVINPIAAVDQLVTNEDSAGNADFVLVHTYQTYSPVMVVYR